MKFRENRKYGDGRSTEEGVALVFFLILAAVILCSAVLVIDTRQLQRAKIGLQRSADAVALAGAAYLLPGTYAEFTPEGDPAPEFASQREGWRAAKRAAIAALKTNPVTGLADVVPAGDLDCGVVACSDSNSYSALDPAVAPATVSPYNFTRYIFSGKLTAVIRRGLYDRTTRNFKSCEEVSSDPELANVPAPCNGFMVELTIMGFETAFSRLGIFGIGSLGPLPVTATSVAANEI